MHPRRLSPQRTVFLSLFVLLTLVPAENIAYADDLGYAVASNQFGILNLSTGAFTSIGTMTSALVGIGVGPGGVLYGAYVDGNVYRVDPSTAGLTLVGNNGLTMNDFTATSDGRLWAVNYGANLYQIDPTTGAATLIGPTGLAPLNSPTSQSGIAGGVNQLFFNIAYYPFSPNDSTLYSLDLTNGSAVFIGTAMTGFPGGTAVGEVGGVVYDVISAVSPLQLYSLDTTTGAATFLRTLDPALVSAVDQVSPIPSPPPTRTAQIQPPLNADGSSVFSVKRGTVPVKFTLAVGGTSTCQLPPATIALSRIAGGTLGAINESDYLQPADAGSNFRITACQYVYNLSSGSLGVGTYLVQINLGVDTVGTATFSLR